MAGAPNPPLGAPENEISRRAIKRTALGHDPPSSSRARSSGAASAEFSHVLAGAAPSGALRRGSCRARSSRSRAPCPPGMAPQSPAPGHLGQMRKATRYTLRETRCGHGGQTRVPRFAGKGGRGTRIKNRSDEERSDRVPGPCAVSDPDHASPARVYEYLTGGSDFFPADKALAERMMDPDKGHPGLRQLARENRSFVLEGVRWAGAMLGIGQVLDLGCGLPARPSVHGSARTAVPSARVAYVDKDPMVVRHVRCVQAEEEWEGTAVIEGDAADPASVLGDVTDMEIFDLTAPVCVVFGGTLSTMDARMARKAVAGFAEALAAGSAVVISCASYRDQGLADRMAGLYGAAGSWRNHSPGEIRSFFDAADLRLIRGEVADVNTWPLLPAGSARDACVLGGIGIRD